MVASGRVQVSDQAAQMGKEMTWGTTPESAGSFLDHGPGAGFVTFEVPIQNVQSKAGFGRANRTPNLSRPDDFAGKTSRKVSRVPASSRRRGTCTGPRSSPNQEHGLPRVGNYRPPVHLAWPL